MFSESLEHGYPVEFIGTEKEMLAKGRELSERYRRSGFFRPVRAWTGYAWRKKGEPSYQFDETGTRNLKGEAA